MTSEIKSLRVPQELIDQFIDHLHDDPASLKACCMVSHSWRPSSQLHLFHSISVAESSVAFIDFLSATPHIAPYIHHLRVYPAPKNGRITTIICPLHTLPTILSRLPQLVSLELFNMCTVCLCNYSPRNTPAPLSIQKLFLHNVAAYDHDAREGVIQLLGIFSSISYLHVLHEESWGTTRRTVFPLDEFKDLIPHLQLDSVLFNAMNFGFVCSSFLTSPVVHSLRRIRATIHHTRDVEPLSEFLSDAGQSLLEVVLDVCPVLKKDGPAEVQPLTIRGLGKCTNLDVLEFVVCGWRSDAAYCQRICDSLALNLALEGLGTRHIHLVIQPEDDEMTMFFDRFQYEACTHSLAKIAGLQEVTVHIATMSDLDITQLEESLVHKLVPKGVALSVVGGFEAMKLH